MQNTRKKIIRPMLKKVKPAIVNKTVEKNNLNLKELRNNGKAVRAQDEWGERYIVTNDRYYLRKINIEDEEGLGITNSVNDALKVKSLDSANSILKSWNRPGYKVRQLGATARVYNPNECRPGETIVKELSIVTKDDVITDERHFITPEVREKVYAKSLGQCVICGKTLLYKDARIDHIVPICRGGKDVEENYQCVCEDCNNIKDGYTMNELKKIIARIANNFCETDNEFATNLNINNACVAGITNEEKGE